MRPAVPFLAMAALAACSPPPPAAEANNGVKAEAPADSEFAAFNGVTLVKSDSDVAETMDRLKEALEEGDFKVVATVDHQANAKGIGVDMPPSRVVIFGKPEAGTPLLKSAAQIALDLPQRMAVYEQPDGTVVIAYNDPMWIASRAGVSGRDAELKAIGDSLAALAAAAAGKAPEAEPAEQNTAG